MLKGKNHQKMSLLLYGPEETGKTFLAGALLGSVEEVKRKGYATLNASALLAEPTRMENIPKALLQFETPYLLIEGVDLLFQEPRAVRRLRRSQKVITSNSASRSRQRVLMRPGDRPRCGGPAIAR